MRTPEAETCADRHLRCLLDLQVSYVPRMTSAMQALYTQCIRRRYLSCHYSAALPASAMHQTGCAHEVEHVSFSKGVGATVEFMSGSAHRRTLFGEAEECLTTLNAWQNMCEEARHFGRALFDAEELVLSTLRSKDESRQP